MPQPPISAELAAWTDLIFVMEPHQRETIRKTCKRGRPADHRIITLHIPDEYERDRPELIALLEQEVRHRIESMLAAGP